MEKSGWVPNMECPGLIRIRRFLIVSFFSDNARQCLFGE